ncbi:MAG: hypothetical protein IIT46_07830 [Lachnospiraceae bacterium]|nr:hypothetical protein [Lachnospiraceae bacterium]
MLEREFTGHKIVLILIFVILFGFTFKYYLPQKSNFSSTEGGTLAIANSNSDITSNPYNICVYNPEEISPQLGGGTFIEAFGNIFSSLHKISADAVSNSVLLSETDYQNVDWVSSEYYNSLHYVAEGNQFNYKSVVNNAILSKKPPIYYILLHIVYSTFQSVDIYRLGFFINAFFLFFSALIIHKLGKNYLRSSWVGLAGAITYILSMGCFSATLCITPYIIVGFLALCTLNLHLLALDKEKVPIYALILLFFVNIIGNLTDYSYLLFSIILSLCVTLWFLFLDNMKRFSLMLLETILSLFFTTILYPSFLLHIGTGQILSWHHFMAKTSMKQLSTDLLTNTNILLEQLFSKTFYIIGVCLFLLFICSLFFKKGTFAHHWNNFKERAYHGNFADLLLPALVLLYIGTLTFFYGSDNYFILTTSLPFISLFLSYLSYRFCHALIHSEFNSGLITTGFLLLISTVSIVISEPHLEFDQNECEITYASETETDNCIFLTSDTLSSKDHISEIASFDQSIVISSAKINIFKKELSLKNLPSVIVFLSNDDFVNGTIDKLTNLGNFLVAEQLTNKVDENGNSIYVYELSKHPVQQ